MELTLQGLILMAVGLSVVFIFLVALVLVMTAGAKLFSRYAHLLPEDTPVAVPATAGGNGGAIVAAIAAALLNKNH